MTAYVAWPVCAAGEQCRAYDWAAEVPEEAGPHALGEACLRAAEHAARALPADWRDLEQMIPKALSVWGDGQPRGGGAAPPIPLNDGVEALQRAIWWVTTAWEEVARDMHRLADAPRRRPGPRVRRFVAGADGAVRVVQVDGRVEHPSALARPMRPGPVDVVRAVRILAPRLGSLSDLPGQALHDYPLTVEGDGEERAGWQGVMDLIALHQRATAVLSLTAPIRRLPGWCGACGAQDTLRQDQPRHLGDEQPVQCGNCAALTTYDDYRAQMGAWAA